MRSPPLLLKWRSDSRADASEAIFETSLPFEVYGCGVVVVNVLRRTHLCMLTAEVYSAIEKFRELEVK